MAPIALDIYRQDQGISWFLIHALPLLSCVADLMILEAIASMPVVRMPSLSVQFLE